MSGADVPILLPYQQRWVNDDSRVQVAEKSRRIGITWASAIRAVIESAAVDGFDTYYTGYNQDLAEEFIRNAGDFARALNAQFSDIETFLFEDKPDDGQEGDSKFILAYRIRFNSGFQIVALSSRPRNLRGKQGRIVIDEFAFHDNPSELLKAAMAALIWGGRVSIISTHNGDDNAFNHLLQDVAAGRFAYSVHRTTFDDAIADGLYERVAAVTGLEVSDKAKAQWRQDIIDFYGDGADEELFCIPRRSGGVYISGALVDACMTPVHKVLRLKLDDDFALLPEDEQTKKIQPWLETQLLPLVKDVGRKRHNHPEAFPTFIGEDFGRRSDITAISLGHFDQRLQLHSPLIVELRNVPFEVQKTVFLYICKHVPKLGRIALDSSGNGMFLGEAVVNAYGDMMVHRVGIKVDIGKDETRSLPWNKWWAENLPKFKARFEEQTISIPKDYDVKQDITTFETVNGVPTLPAIRKTAKAPDAGPGDYRHGDAGVALALMEYAAREGAMEIVSGRVAERGGDFGTAGNGTHLREDLEDLKQNRIRGRGFRRKGVW